jgi:PBSX family phage terminase large subunit|nr:MAG TPA: large terminase [Caudoviricetes sp.]
MANEAIFHFEPFSNKQKMILTWWRPSSPVSHLDGIIADGAIRSGKTLSMSLSFVMWAMDSFNGYNFAICGKTIGSLRRNVITTLKQMLRSRGYRVTDKRADNLLIIRRGKKSNIFYLFGGRDESSQDLVQGVTLAGVFFDEVVLMPESFVNQATGRCSVDGSKFWFNCNPANPMHWFKVNWIDAVKDDAEKPKNLLYLHFMMDDNLSLSEDTKRRYKQMYSGVFYSRYILGRWVSADGLIYDMFDQDKNLYRPEQRPVAMVWNSQRTIACDYGTTNPCVFLDIYDDGGVIRVDGEYRWDSRKEMRQKTDGEYADDLIAFMGDKSCSVIIDPSAASFIAELRSRGLYVIPADNEVLDGIRRVSTLLAQSALMVCDSCTGLIKEMGSYIWDDKAAMRGEEKPVKQLDHGPDALRYYINSLPDWRFE